MNSDRMSLKAKAINYFQQTGIPKSVENCLNDLFNVNPLDPYGYLSTYFEVLSKPSKIARIEACESTGDIGCNAITVTIFGIFRNEEMVLTRISTPNNVFTTPGVNLLSSYIKTHNDIIKRCVSEINEHLNSLLIGVDPRNFEEITNILRSDAEIKQIEYEEMSRDKGENESSKEEAKSKVESAKKSNIKKGPPVVVIPDDPPEIICPLVRAHAAVSVALAIAAAKIDKHSLCEQIEASINGGEKVERPTLPLVALLRNGKGLPGKCQWIKRCLLVPNGLYASSDHIAADIRLISLTLASNLQTKTPMATVSEYGEIVPSFDRAEQFIEVIQDVLKECDMEEKMRVVVEVGARGIFDMDKGKYEVLMGQMKSGEEFVAMMVDLVDRYPIIAGLVDPLRTQEKDNWRRLSASVSNRCWILGRYPHSVGHLATETSLVKDEAGNDAVAMSIICISVDGVSRYDQYLECGVRLAGQGQMMCLWLEDLSTEHWVMDLACGLRAALVAIPGIRCASGARKIDHWVSLLAGSLPGSSLVFPELCQQPQTPSEVTE